MKQQRAILDAIVSCVATLLKKKKKELLGDESAKEMVHLALAETDQLLKVSGRAGINRGFPTAADKIFQFLLRCARAHRIPAPVLEKLNAFMKAYQT